MWDSWNSSLRHGAARGEEAGLEADWFFGVLGGDDEFGELYFQELKRIEGGGIGFVAGKALHFV